MNFFRTTSNRLQNYFLNHLIVFRIRILEILRISNDDKLMRKLYVKPPLLTQKTLVTSEIHANLLKNSSLVFRIQTQQSLKSYDFSILTFMANNRAAVNQNY